MNAPMLALLASTASYSPGNGITASLGVLERYVGNVEPEAGNLTNYQVNNGFADVPEGVWGPPAL